MKTLSSRASSVFAYLDPLGWLQWSNLVEGQFHGYEWNAMRTHVLSVHLFCIWKFSQCLPMTIALVYIFLLHAA